MNLKKRTPTELADKSRRDRLKSCDCWIVLWCKPLTGIGLSHSLGTLAVHTSALNSFGKFL